MDELNGSHVFGNAKCRLVPPVALPMNWRGRVSELVGLYTDEAHRCSGDASQLLHNVCRLADDADVMLILSVENDSPALCSFYTRFGFLPIQAKPLLMARMVGAAPLARSAVNKALDLH